MESSHLIKTLAALVVTFFVFSLIPANASKLQEMKEKQQQINQEMQQKKQVIQEKQKEYRSTLGHLKNLEQDMENVQGDLNTLQHKLSLTEKRLQRTEEELRMAETQLAERTEIFRNRLVEVYLNGEVSYLEVIFSATDMRDFLVRMDLLSQLLKHDMGLIDEIDKKVSEIEVKKNSIAQHKEQIAKIRKNTESKEKQLAKQTEEKKTLLTDIESQKEAAEKALNQLERESNQIASEIRRIQAAANRVRKVRKGNGRFAWPTPGYERITSPYGWRIHPILKTKRMHTGVDIGAPMGADMVASDEGTVIYSGWFGAYGKVVIVDHGSNISTMYAHMSKISVSEGQTVKAGERVGGVGSTGWSTGPHAHYEVRINGDPVNPMPYLQ